MSETTATPNTADKMPNFETLQEAFEWFLAHTIKPRHTQESLFHLKEILVRQKASMRIDPDASLAKAAAEDAWVAGQLSMLETLLEGGKIVD